jgi:hypothetical protein
VWYELGFYIKEDAILHSHRREHLNSYTEIALVARVDTEIANSTRIVPRTFHHLCVLVSLYGD